MVERMRMPVVVGRGVDRATGLAAQQPQFPVYAANVYGRDAKVAVRPGMAGTGFPPLAWGTDILKVYGVKATHDLLYVVFDRDSLEIRVYRLDTANGVLQTLATPANGLWGTLNSLADFPVVSVAESGGEVFFAHDEDTIDFRLPTVVYTPDYVSPATPGSLEVLTAILTPDGVVMEPVYFRGVFAYLEFNMGWGFGSVDEPDRGDIVRVSRPTAPRDFRTPNYLACGSQKEPIIGAGVLGDPEEGGGILIFGKEDEMYRVPGTNFDTFRPQLHDPDFGFVSSRVTRSVGRRLFTWSGDGAREVTMGGSVSIAQPLELISPLPEELPLLGPSRMAFAAFDKARKRLGWYWPEPVTARVPVPGFLLSLWNPDDPRWTFDLIEQPILCEGTLLSTDTGTAPDPPVGYVSDVVAEDIGISTDPRYRQVRLAWVNNEQAGSETVQVFAKPAGGAWSSVLLTAVSDAADQVAVWDTALPLTAYAIAVRYLNGSTPAEGYEEGNPDEWTAATAAGSKTTVSTTSAGVDTLTASPFVNSSTPIALAWTSAQLAVPYLLEKNVDGAGWVEVVDALEATSYNYPIVPAELGLEVEFRVRAERGALQGPLSDVVAVLMDVVVGATAFTLATFNPANGAVALAWSAAANATSYLLEKSVNGGAAWTTAALQPGTSFGYTIPASEANLTLKFRVTGRNGATSGPTSAVQDLATTITLTAPTLTALGAWTLTADPPGYANCTGSITHNGAVGNAQALYFYAQPAAGGAVSSSTIPTAAGTHAIGPIAVPTAPNVAQSINVYCRAWHPILGYSANSNTLAAATPVYTLTPPTLSSVTTRNPDLGFVVAGTPGTHNGGGIRIYARQGGAAFAVAGTIAAGGGSTIVTPTGSYPGAVWEFKLTGLSPGGVFESADSNLILTAW